MSDLRISEVDTLPAISRCLPVSAGNLRNLATRHDSFPKPVRSFGKAEVYEIRAVINWVTWRYAVGDKP